MLAMTRHGASGEKSPRPGFDGFRSVDHVDLVRLVGEAQLGEEEPHLVAIA